MHRCWFRDTKGRNRDEPLMMCRCVSSVVFPIRLTRHLPSARQWLREQARGNERYGMVVSSRAQRLKPLAIDVRVKVGQKVEQGAVLLVLEAMKMEHSLTAPWAADVVEVKVQMGQRVEEGTDLIRLVPAA